VGSVSAATTYSDLLGETVDFCSTLIRFDTSNFGGGESRGERQAAEWVAERLSEVGLAPELFEAAPGRASTVVRLPGADREAGGLLVHGHLDVVPAAPADWNVDPFGGEVRNGAVWGRGALDMKNMDAMMLALARKCARDGIVPPRDLVLAFVADEEDTGRYGAAFLAEQHADLFEGVSTAIGESGGYAMYLPDGARLYPVATGERGSAWMNLLARGTAGHGSRPNPDNAVATLAAAIVRIAGHRWPVQLTPTVQALLDGLGEHLGVHLDPGDPASLKQVGEAAGLLEATVRNSLNPTMLSAGYKHNVIPSEATAGVDGRILPGTDEAFFAKVDELLGPDVTRSFASYSPPVAAEHRTAEFAAMAAALRAEDPEGLVLPFCMAGGTDAQAFSDLGIACYGFAPGRTAAGFTYSKYVHGVDEHVLIESLDFGVRVLERYLLAPPGAGPAPVS
jgi:acetylornithine deacetylase/succinyl-diaminopimelate desuccinylase-like protein